MLETAQVDFDEQINVTLIVNLRHRVVVALKRLTPYGYFELKVLTSKVAQSFVRVLIIEDHAIDKSVGGQFFLHREPHWDRLVELLYVATVFAYDKSCVLLDALDQCINGC